MTAKINLNNKRKSIPQVEEQVNELSGNVDRLERPHKISFNITSSDLMKFKMYCITNKVKQQDQAYIVFKNWIESKDLKIL